MNHSPQPRSCLSRLWHQERAAQLWQPWKASSTALTYSSKWKTTRKKWFIQRHKTVSTKQHIMPTGYLSFKQTVELKCHKLFSRLTDFPYQGILHTSPEDYCPHTQLNPTLPPPYKAGHYCMDECWEDQSLQIARDRDRLDARRARGRGLI